MGLPQSAIRAQCGASTMLGCPYSSSRLMELPSPNQNTSRLGSSSQAGCGKSSRQFEHISNIIYGLRRLQASPNLAHFLPKTTVGVLVHGQGQHGPRDTSELTIADLQ